VPAQRRIPLGVVLALLAVLTSLPLAVFAGALIYRTSKHQQEQVDRQNIEVARAISGAVDDEIEHTEAALAVLASIVPSDPSGLEAFYRICEETVAMQDWQAIRLATPSGDIVLSTDAPFGAAVHTSSPDWILRAAATAASAISSVRKDPDLKQWIVAIGVPVKKGAAVRYVIGARLFTKGFSEILQRQQLPPGGIVTLLDDTSVIVARTVNEDLGQNVLVIVGQIRATGTRFQAGDVFQGVLDLINLGAGPAGNLWDPPFAQRLHEVADDAVLESILLVGSLQLQHQAFTQIPGSHPDRVKTLNHFQNLENVFSSNTG